MNMARALFPPFVGGRMGVGLLILRVVLGLGMMAHGYAKMFGPSGPTGWMNRPGAPPGPPGLIQAIGAVGEFFGGLGILVGALTPIAALGVVATMIGAVLIGNAGKPWLSTAPGAETWEMAGFYLFGGLALMLLGPGRFSIDNFLFSRRQGHDADRIGVERERIRV